MTLEIKGEIDVLRLQPGDVLVVTVPEPILTEEAWHHLTQEMNRLFPGIKHTILLEGTSLSVVRPGEQQADEPAIR